MGMSVSYKHNTLKYFQSEEGYSSVLRNADSHPRDQMAPWYSRSQS